MSKINIVSLKAVFKALLQRLAQCMWLSIAVKLGNIAMKIFTKQVMPAECLVPSYQDAIRHNHIKIEETGWRMQQL